LKNFEKRKALPAQTFSSVFAFAAENVLKIAETPRFGGETLVFMALDAGLGGTSGRFFSVPRWRWWKNPGKTLGKRVRNGGKLENIW